MIFKKFIKKHKNIFFIIIKIINILIILIGFFFIIIILLLSKYIFYIKEILFTFNLVKDKYYKKPNFDIFLKYMPYYIIKTSTDEYSNYHDKTEFQLFLNKLSGKYSGIGIVFKKNEKTKKIEVLKVFEDTPAFKNGIKKGNVLLKIQEKELNNLSIDEIKNMLIGEEGKSVKISLFDKEKNKTIKFSIKRKKITIPTVSGFFINDNSDIFYIKIDSFQENTDKEFIKLIHKLNKKPKKIILDLRNNLGGIVEKALLIAEYFVPKGIIMHEIDRNEKISKSFVSKGDKFLNIPLIVIINNQTASSSEIITGAIKDNRSGLLIGEKTFGKGVVQSFFPTPNEGVIFLTTKKYLTPKKINIHEKGIIPDIEIKILKNNNIIDFYDEINKSNYKDDIFIKKAINIFKGIKNE